MANQTQDLKQEIRSTLSVIHSINDDPALQNNDAVKDAVTKDLPSQQGQYPKQLSDLKSKLKRKKENTSNVFQDLCDIAEPFLGTSQKYQASKYKLPVQNRLKQIIEDSAEVVMRSATQIILTCAEETLFAGDGICGSQTPIPSDTAQMSPTEFDYLNTLTIDPFSKTGQILYEDINDINNQMNRNLYGLFNNHTPYDFMTGPTQKLFTVNWDDASQSYTFSGLTENNMTTGNFLKQFYSNISTPKKEDAIRMCILLISNGEQNTKMFDLSINQLNRILGRIFSNCGNPKKTGLNQVEPQFAEFDDDVESYFDFDDVEGIDLDDEDRRYRKVLKFVDCNNFEFPVPIQHLEDFVVLQQTNNLPDCVNDFLENMANDAANSSDSSLTPQNFHLSLFKNYNLNMPYAMIASILSPKMLLPITMLYKLLGSGSKLSAKDLIKKLYKLFFKIMTKVLWSFIKEVWSRLKKDLLDFLKITALNILKEKFARYYKIIASLIAFLKKILEKNLDNCQTLYKLITEAIQTALSAASINLNIPGFLLSLANFRNGYSQTRAIMNVTKIANSKGVDTTPIYGNTNKLNHVFASLIKGHDEENSTNSKIVTGNLLTVIPIAGLAGPLVIPPGAIKTSGVKL